MGGNSKLNPESQMKLSSLLQSPNMIRIKWELIEGMNSKISWIYQIYKFNGLQKQW